MKKILFAILFVLGVSTVSEAQVNERAAGLRFGMGGELSYQHPLTDRTRAEFNVGIYGVPFGDFMLTGVYQWIFAEIEGFNFYGGAGPQMGSIWRKNVDHYVFGIGFVGQIGAEYNLDTMPLQFSLDWRPSWTLFPIEAGGRYGGAALGVRYRF